MGPNQPRVLIVDDHRLFADLITPPLEERGHTVIGLATTGPSALATVRHERPELVLLDLSLGGEQSSSVEFLTPREYEVLMLLAEGANSIEMAERLVLSPNTIRTHVQSVLTKLHVHSRIEAAATAVRLGLVNTHRQVRDSNGFHTSGVGRLPLASRVVGGRRN